MSCTARCSSSCCSARSSPHRCCVGGSNGAATCGSSSPARRRRAGRAAGGRVGRGSRRRHHRSPSSRRRAPSSRSPSRRRRWSPRPRRARRTSCWTGSAARRGVPLTLDRAGHPGSARRAARRRSSIDPLPGRHGCARAGASRTSPRPSSGAVTIRVNWTRRMHCASRRCRGSTSWSPSSARTSGRPWTTCCWRRGGRCRRRRSRPVPRSARCSVSWPCRDIAAVEAILSGAPIAPLGRRRPRFVRAVRAAPDRHPPRGSLDRRRRLPLGARQRRTPPSGPRRTAQPGCPICWPIPSCSAPAPTRWPRCAGARRWHWRPSRSARERLRDRSAGLPLDPRARRAGSPGPPDRAASPPGGRAGGRQPRGASGSLDRRRRRARRRWAAGRAWRGR